MSDSKWLLFGPAPPHRAFRLGPSFEALELFLLEARRQLAPEPGAGFKTNGDRASKVAG